MIILETHKKIILEIPFPPLVNKHAKVNKVLKGIPITNLSELTYIAKASVLLVCEKVGVKINPTINKKEPFWKRIIEKGIASLRKDDGKMTVPS